MDLFAYLELEHQSNRHFHHDNKCICSCCRAMEALELATKDQIASSTVLPTNKLDGWLCENHRLEKAPSEMVEQERKEVVPCATERPCDMELFCHLTDDAFSILIKRAREFETQDLKILLHRLACRHLYRFLGDATLKRSDKKVNATNLVKDIQDILGWQEPNPNPLTEKDFLLIVSVSVYVHAQHCLLLKI